MQGFWDLKTIVSRKREFAFIADKRKFPHHCNFYSWQQDLPLKWANSVQALYPESRNLSMKMDPLEYLDFVKKNMFRHCCLEFRCGNSADENCHFPTSIVGSSHRRDPETVSSVTTTTRAPNKFTVKLEFKLMFRNWSRMADRICHHISKVETI